MAVVDDTDKPTNDPAQERIAKVREKVEALMEQRVTPALANAADQAEMVSARVRQSPLTAILIATGVGYVLGRMAR